MPKPKRFHVRWDILVEEDDVGTSREAAEFVWRKYFGRSLPPEADSCCGSEVAASDNEWTFETVDLEKPGGYRR